MFELTPYNRRRNRGLDRRVPNWFGLDEFIEDFFNDSMFPTFFSQNRGMRVDIKENENEYVLEAELPGVDKDSITLEIKDDILTIGVDQKEQVEEERENYIRKERRVCSMSRSFQLPDIKNEDVSANFKNGILTIVLPKKNPGKNRVRKIDIQ